MEKDRLLGVVLGKEHEPGRKSCFTMALKTARYNMGRDIETGKSFDKVGGVPVAYTMRNEIADNWMFNEATLTGLIMYLVLLDQMGCLFANEVKKAQKTESGVKYALRSFSDLSEEDREAIHALRCTLAHNFGLATEKKRGKAYRFTLSFDAASPAVSFPEKEWSGDYSDKSDKTSTIIGIHALCNEIESVVNNIFDAYEHGNLTFRVEDSDEVCSRFTLIV